jgi:hypothetical protein
VCSNHLFSRSLVRDVHHVVGLDGVLLRERSLLRDYLCAEFDPTQDQERLLITSLLEQRRCQACILAVSTARAAKTAVLCPSLPNQDLSSVPSNFREANLHLITSAVLSLASVIPPRPLTSSSIPDSHQETCSTVSAQLISFSRLFLRW